MILVRFSSIGSVHNSVVFRFSERDVLTCSLVLCLVHDHVCSHAYFTYNTTTIIIYILCITRSEFLYFYRHWSVIVFMYISQIDNFFWYISHQENLIFLLPSTCNSMRNANQHSAISWCTGLRKYVLVCRLTKFEWLRSSGYSTTIAVIMLAISNRLQVLIPMKTN